VFKHWRKNAPIEALSATGHNEAPLPLIDLGDPTRPATVGTDVMTYEQLEDFGHELDAVRERVLHELGQSDADYIRRVIRTQLSFDTAGRALLLIGSLVVTGVAIFWIPLVLGVVALGVSKILENMEVGHNVMHGQYDWMNDPLVDGQSYEWDNVAPAEDWRRGHNYLHHTYTNILGKDRDLGYNLLRVDSKQIWYPNHVLNVPLALVLALLFEWAVAYHGLELDGYINQEFDSAEFRAKRKRAARKARFQILKDYVAYPSFSLIFPIIGLFWAPLAGTWWAPVAVIAANFVANVVRNIWTFTIIFCGHFPVGAETFTEVEAQNESRGQWYYRQLLGSMNIRGTRVFHIMSGNLSYHIEHHMFPDIPACRYPEITGDVKRLIEKYGLRYNTGRVSQHMFSVFRQLFVNSFKPSDPWLVGKSDENKALRRAKRAAKQAQQEQSVA
jgi:NADPH-dependent stearoyl-CoA 9-desaturase